MPDRPCARVSAISVNNANRSKRTTRNSQKLNIPLFKAANGQGTFYYRIVIKWNSLHSSLKTINSMPIFKYSPKHELLEDFIDS